MTAFVVTPTARPLAGSVVAPGDKSIGHRALLFAALARTPVVVRGLGRGADNGRTARAIVALGATTERQGDLVIVRGPGLRALAAPAAPIDCGNSGTTIRLLTGLCAGQRFTTELFGDESLSRRPMARVIEPLAAMGAHIRGRDGGADVTPPLIIDPCPGGLRGRDHALPIASAQVKTALILAGLTADGVTRVREPHRSRDHSEHLLAAMGAPITIHDRTVTVAGGAWDGELAIDDLTVPGDPSSAAFLVAAALVAGVGGDGVCITGVGANPTRTGFLDALAAMGATVERRDARDYYRGEPGATLAVTAAPALTATRLDGELVVRAIDEIPILAAVAAIADGETVVADASELRVKESDRVDTTVAMLRAFGVDAEPRQDGLVVRGRGRRPLRAAHVDAAGDHRIAMAASVLALVADGPTRIDDADNVATSYPGFVAAMTALGADLRVQAT